MFSMDDLKCAPSLASFFFSTQYITAKKFIKKENYFIAGEL
jgi:hypothetical protein